MYILGDWYPFSLLHLSTIYRLPSDIVHFNTLDKVERHHAINDGLNFNELLLVDLVPSQLQMGFLLDFTYGAFYRRLFLVDLTFWEIKLLHDLVPWIMVDAK